MRKKRFSLAQLLLAIALTAAAVLGCGLLAVRAWMGEGGRSLVEGLRLVNTLFVGEYDETEVVDAALEGMVSRLGDRWSYYLTAEELEWIAWKEEQAALAGAGMDGTLRAAELTRERVYVLLEYLA